MTFSPQDTYESPRRNTVTQFKITFKKEYLNLSKIECFQ